MVKIVTINSVPAVIQNSTHIHNKFHYLDQYMQNNSMIPSNPSVQNMFNGNYTMQWLINKAEYELALSFKSFTYYKENIANLSVTLAHLCDWALAFKPSIFAECSDMQGIRDIARIECPKALFFVDISNEYKHADRTSPSRLIKELVEYFEIIDSSTIDNPAVDFENEGFIVGRTGNKDRNYLIKPDIM